MSFKLTSADYLNYIRRAAEKIYANGEYISDLDAATGDGDHWANINIGFEKLVANAEQLSDMPISDCFKRIGILMMNTIGGSSGILYGGAYMAAGKAMIGRETVDSEGLATVLEVMVNDMMARGNSQPGHKTMIDALSPAVQTYKDCITKGMDAKNTLLSVKKAAEDGAELTREMKAVRGRACYQANKGVGHLDPGAVTMSYQIGCLVDYIIENIL